MSLKSFYNKDSNLLRIITLSITLIYWCATSQQINPTIGKTHISKFLENEKNFKGGKILDSRFISAFPQLDYVSYIRSDNSIPDIDLILRYVFYKKDSLLKEVRYEWDVANFEKTSKKRDIKFRNVMTSFFLQTTQALELNYGKGEEEGNLIDSTSINIDNEYYKRHNWIIGDTKISLQLEMSNNNRLINKKEFPNHRIVLTYTVLDINDKLIFKGEDLLKENR